MNSLFFTELKKCCNSLDCVTDDEVGKAIEIYDTLLRFALISRTEGLWQLEDAANELEGENEIAFLRKMIELITWGTEPILIEEFGIETYCSKAGDGIDALIILMIIRGTLLIQEGNIPRVVKDQLYAMLPRIITDRIDKRDKELEPTKEELLRERIEELCEDKEDKSYRKKLSDIVINASDNQVSEILEGLKEDVFARMVVALSAEARRKIFSVLPLDEASLVVEDIDYYGRVRESCLEETCNDIYWKLDISLRESE